MKFKFILASALLLVLLNGCSSREQALPSGTTTVETESVDLKSDIITVHEQLPLISSERIQRTEGLFLDNGLRCDYFTLPDRAHVSYGDGVFTLCADPVEMNRGNHYNALYLREDGSEYLQRSYFSSDYEILGQWINISFEYACFGDEYVTTYVSEDADFYRIYSYVRRDGAILVVLDIPYEEKWISYPVFLNPETGELAELFGSIPTDQLPDGSLNSIAFVNEQCCLVRLNADGYYVYDSVSSSVVRVSDFTGYEPIACAAVPSGIVCYDGVTNFQLLSVANYSLTDISLDISAVECFHGLTTTGNQTFALYRDDQGSLYWYDFTEMNGGTLTEPSGWSLEPERLYPSYDGRRLFWYRIDDQETIQALIFDADLGQWILLNRSNPNTVSENRIYWCRDGSLVIASDTGREFYVYQWKERMNPMLEENDTLLHNPQDSDFVRVLDYIPDLEVEMKYAFPDNFTGHTIYESEEAWLRYGTVKKLMTVQEEFRPMGLRLKLWDGFRPVAAQFKLWEILPDDTYVADPNQGFSSHSRGNTVDITLVDASGVELEMPTEFDDFSTRADRDYSEIPENAAQNAMLLEDAMQRNGFIGYYGEWWHFADSVRYDVENCFDPGVISLWYADCREFISLRARPDTSAEVLDRIPVRETCTLLGYTEEFAYVQYRGQRGYVLLSYLKRI